MDDVSRALREDAAKIRAEVSPELDARIRASLEGVSPQKTRDRGTRRFSMWWASSLTGIAAAGVLVLVISPERRDQVPAAGDQPAANPLSMLELRTETAMFIGPLQEELEFLESDLRKAERAVKEEIGLTL